MGWGKSGKGAGAQSFLQAALEGAVVNALGLARYETSNTKGKGAQGTGKGSTGAQTLKPAFPCYWEDCDAAQLGTLVRAGSTQCFAANVRGGWRSTPRR